MRFAQAPDGLSVILGGLTFSVALGVESFLCRAQTGNAASRVALGRITAVTLPVSGL
jgi:hypothetical protein